VLLWSTGRKVSYLEVALGRIGKGFTPRPTPPCCPCVWAWTEESDEWYTYPRGKNPFPPCTVCSPDNPAAVDYSDPRALAAAMAELPDGNPMEGVEGGGPDSWILPAALAQGNMEPVLFLCGMFLPFFVCMFRAKFPTFTGSVQEMVTHFCGMGEPMRSTVFADYLATVKAHAENLKDNPEVGFRVGSATPAGPAGGPRAGGNGSLFKAHMPELSEFSGKGDRKIDLLHAIANWIDEARTSAQLAGLDPSTSVLWAVRFLRGPAQTWWRSRTPEQRQQCTSLDALQAGLIDGLHLHQPFTMLVEDFQSRTVHSFRSYEAFKAWLTRTVSAMHLFSEGRMWGEAQLVDRVKSMLLGSLYYEGVSLDTDTGAPPSTYDRAMVLLDKQHRLLLARGTPALQAWASDSIPLDPRLRGGKRPRTEPPRQQQQQQSQTSSQSRRPGSSGSGGAGPSGSGSGTGSGDHVDPVFLPAVQSKALSHSAAAMFTRFAAKLQISPADWLANWRKGSKSKNVCAACGQEGHWLNKEAPANGCPLIKAKGFDIHSFQGPKKGQGQGG
jgi:hypothetical protein